MKRTIDQARPEAPAATALTDYLFTGVAVLPAALALLGHFDAALMLITPLLLAACLCGAGECGPALNEDPAEDRARD